MRHCLDTAGALRLHHRRARAQCTDMGAALCLYARASSVPAVMEQKGRAPVGCHTVTDAVPERLTTGEHGGLTQSLMESGAGRERMCPLLARRDGSYFSEDS